MVESTLSVCLSVSLPRREAPGFPRREPRVGAVCVLPRPASGGAVVWGRAQPVERGDETVPTILWAPVAGSRQPCGQQGRGCRGPGCEAVGCSAMGRARGSLHQRWAPRRALGGLKRPCSSLDTAFRATGFDQSRLFSGVSGFTDGPDFVSTALAKSVVPARSPAVLGAGPPWGHPAAHTRGS